MLGAYENDDKYKEELSGKKMLIDAGDMYELLRANIIPPHEAYFLCMSAVKRCEKDEVIDAS